jgi:hypothetical protein
MKYLTMAMVVALMVGGCATFGSNEPHADGPGATTPTAGPTLCHDGTAPPCNDRR